MQNKPSKREQLERDWRVKFCRIRIVFNNLRNMCTNRDLNNDPSSNVARVLFASESFRQDMGT